MREACFDQPPLNGNEFVDWLRRSGRDRFKAPYLLLPFDHLDSGCEDELWQMYIDGEIRADEIENFEAVTGCKASDI